MVAYDIVTVGGGVGGAALGRVMAERGYRVLVVEREGDFRDRVRGEYFFPWGVAEAQALGIYLPVLEAGGHHPTYWADYAGPNPLPSRDFAVDTPQKLRGLAIYHPRLQEAMLAAAVGAGAEVWRGARVRHVEPGREPKLVLEGRAGRSSVSARLVVGADGRSSMTRTWGGFASHRDPPGNLFTGVLVENVAASADRTVCMINPFESRMILYVPQRERGVGRAYLASRVEEGYRFQSAAGFDSFLAECTRSGLVEGVLDGARQAGPLATFEGADSWVEHPYRAGVALIGDAAATSDPTWGQGLSLTLRDVRELRDALLATDDWDGAGHAYAAAHDRYYAGVRTTNSWFTRIMLEPGPEADAIRGRAFPAMESDPQFLPDTIVAGPDHAPPTEQHRERIFGAASGPEPVPEPPAG